MDIAWNTWGWGSGKGVTLPVMGKALENYLEVFISVRIHDCYSVCPGSKEHLLTYFPFTPKPR